jgi:Leucine-rich repeat (LRR) protein
MDLKKYLDENFSELKNLKSLDLANKQITDLTPLAGLVMLENLWLNNTQITDITPLADLKNLSVYF